MCRLQQSRYCSCYVVLQNSPRNCFADSIVAACEEMRLRADTCFKAGICLQFGIIMSIIVVGSTSTERRCQVAENACSGFGFGATAAGSFSGTEGPRSTVVFKSNAVPEELRHSGADARLPARDMVSPPCSRLKRCNLQAELVSPSRTSRLQYNSSNRHAIVSCPNDDELSQSLTHSCLMHLFEQKQPL